MNQVSKMELEIREIPEVLERLLESQAEISKVVEKIKSAKVQSVMIAARGTSDNAAHFLKHLIEVELGIPVGLASPSVVSIYKSDLNYKKTLVIALSQSGQSPDLVRYLEAAKEGGGMTLAVTNNETSPLADVSDNHLQLRAEKEFSIAATKSYTAQLFISLVIVHRWKGSEIGLSNLKAESIRILDSLGSIENIFESISTKSSIVALGRGYSYGNAKELALKIQETSLIAVQGMSAADYLHGPIAAVNDDTRVFIFCPRGSSPDGLEKSVSRLRQKTKNLIWIGESLNAESGELSVDGSRINNEQISTVLDSIILQMIACKFAVKNGLNPDFPNGLSKVTLTL